MTLSLTLFLDCRCLATTARSPGELYAKLGTNWLCGGFAKRFAPWWPTEPPKGKAPTGKAPTGKVPTGAQQHRRGARALWSTKETAGQRVGQQAAQSVGRGVGQRGRRGLERGERRLEPWERGLQEGADEGPWSWLPRAAWQRFANDTGAGRDPAPLEVYSQPAHVSFWAQPWTRVLWTEETCACAPYTSATTTATTIPPQDATVPFATAHRSLNHHDDDDDTTTIDRRHHHHHHHHNRMSDVIPTLSLSLAPFCLSLPLSLAVPQVRRFCKVTSQARFWREASSPQAAARSDLGYQVRALAREP